MENYTIETLKNALEHGEEIYLGYNFDYPDETWFMDGGVYSNTDYSVRIDDNGKYEVYYCHISDDGGSGGEDTELYDTYEDFISWLKSAHLENCPILLTESLYEDAFKLDFDNVNAYGEILTEDKEDRYICCICGEECIGYGNNPEPVKHEGRCCDACNLHYVIPARIAAIKPEEE